MCFPKYALSCVCKQSIVAYRVSHLEADSNVLFEIRTISVCKQIWVDDRVVS